MTFGRLVCEPLTVREVIGDPDLDNKHVAVHGILYLGQGCREDEFLLLPKEGPFDGVGPIPMPEALNRSDCLFIEQPDMWNKVGKSGAAGLYHWKHDCILVGQFRHRPGTDHPFRVGDLWLLILQDWLDCGKGQPFHELRLVLFSPPNSIELPWVGPVTKRRGDSLIRVNP